LATFSQLFYNNMIQNEHFLATFLQNFTKLIEISRQVVNLYRWRTIWIRRSHRNWPCICTSKPLFFALNQITYSHHPHIVKHEGGNLGSTAIF